MNDLLVSLSAIVERLNQVAGALEKMAAQLERGDTEPGVDAGKITAAIDTTVEVSRRELELERKLLQAEQTLAALQAEGARELPQGESKVAVRAFSLTSSRKTLPAATVQLLAKQGIDAGDSVDVQSLDAALAGLSVEQRIAVKSQMLRTGALTL
jgi:exonuclease VII small subunit